MRKLLIALAAAALLSGAIAPQAVFAQGGAEQKCNAGKTAGGGAVIGALIGGLLAGSKNRSAGLLIGGALGAAVGGLGCMEANNRVKQSRSNEEVAALVTQRVGTVTRPTVLAYESRFASAQYARSDDIVVQSHMFVVFPADNQGNVIEERYTVVAPSGERKVFVKPVAQTGGELFNDLTFNVPKALPGGVYHVVSELIVNGQPVTAKENSFQLI